jgi:hypothetical protein
MDDPAYWRTLDGRELTREGLVAVILGEDLPGFDPELGRNVDDDPDALDVDLDFTEGFDVPLAT